MKKIVIVILIAAAFILLSFLGVAAVVKLGCWAFGIAFSWRIAIGVYAVMTLVSWSVKSHSNGGKA